MKPYSEDLRVRIVRAVQEEGISKSATARLFGVSLSSVKRYVRISDWGASLTPRKGGGRPPKVDQSTSRLLVADTGASYGRRLRDVASWSTPQVRL